MAEIVFQIHLKDAWHDAGTITLASPEAGIGAPAVFDYDLDYWMHQAAIEAAEGHEVIDLRAASIRLPVDVASHYEQRWHAFLLDLIPQGKMRRALAAENKWRDDDRRLDCELLLRGAGSPVGNIRIKTAWESDRQRYQPGDFAGVTQAQMLRLDDAFLDVWERASLGAAGSEGVQGEWPKILMTQSADGLYYPDPIVADDEARAHVLVKRAKPNSALAVTILANEPHYLALARDFGLRVAAPMLKGDHVIIVPRFDRVVHNDKTIRLGQESIISALGVAEWSHSTTHETYLAMLRRTSTHPEADIIEYVLRDLLNMATGNPDNHGRNTALQKFPDGTITLSPLFDFAPMRRATDGRRVTKWDRGTTSDSTPDWRAIAQAACGEDFSPRRLLDALRQREGFIRHLPDHARRLGITSDIIEDCMIRHKEIAESLAVLSLKP